MKKHKPTKKVLFKGITAIPFTQQETVFILSSSIENLSDPENLKAFAEEVDMKEEAAKQTVDKMRIFLDSLVFINSICE